jgi:hypothetical protein
MVTIVNYFRNSAPKMRISSRSLLEILCCLALCVFLPFNTESYGTVTQVMLGGAGKPLTLPIMRSRVMHRIPISLRLRPSLMNSLQRNSHRSLQ